MSKILTPTEFIRALAYYANQERDEERDRLFATIDALAEALRASIAQREAMLAQNWLIPETGPMLTAANIREHNATTRVAAWLEADDE